MVKLAYYAVRFWDEQKSYLETIDFEDNIPQPHLGDELNYKGSLYRVVRREYFVHHEVGKCSVYIIAKKIKKVIIKNKIETAMELKLTKRELACLLSLIDTFSSFSDGIYDDGTAKKELKIVDLMLKRNGLKRTCS